MEGWSSEATGVSIGPIFGSGCSSWGASCCGIVLFSFSASVAGSSISATVASLALTAVSAAGTGVSFLDRVAMWPHSGAQGDTCGNHCHYDEFLHFSSSLDAKRAPDPIAVWQETERSFS